MSDAMDAEFDTVAEWTAEAAQRLGDEFILPAACRGSGSPAALDWLIDALDLQGDDVLVDSGAGVGGPAAYAVQSRRVRALLVEPEAGACRAAATLFGFPVVQASGSALPVADHAVDAAWSLGVLCTMEDQIGLLTELRRVVRPPGRVGLLVYVATRELSADEVPEGNHFPTDASLKRLFDESGFAVVARERAAELDDPPPEWDQRVDDVDGEIKRLHQHEETWQVAEKQSDTMAELVTCGAVVATLYSLRTLN